MMISNFQEIGLRIGFAILRDEMLTLEYDSGLVEVSGTDLLDAWEHLDLTDPFTIVAGRSPLRPEGAKKGTNDDTL